MQQRFKASPRLISSSMLLHRICLVGAVAAAAWCVVALAQGRSRRLVAIVAVYGVLSLAASVRLRSYAKRLAAGGHDLVLSGDVLHLSERVEIKREQVVDVGEDLRVRGKLVRLVLRTSRPRRTYRVDLRRFPEGSEIPAAIDEWWRAED